MCMKVIYRVSCIDIGVGIEKWKFVIWKGILEYGFCNFEVWELGMGDEDRWKWVLIRWGFIIVCKNRYLDRSISLFHTIIKHHSNKTHISSSNSLHHPTSPNPPIHSLYTKLNLLPNPQNPQITPFSIST